MRDRRTTRLTVERCEDRTAPAGDLSSLTFSHLPGLGAAPPPPPPPAGGAAALTTVTVPGAYVADYYPYPPPGYRLDPTFGTGGRTYLTPDLVPASLYGSAADLAVGPDGKVVVLGTISGGAVVARFHPNGTLDPSFGGDGVVSVGPWDESVRSLSLARLAVLADGRVLVAGTIFRDDPAPAPGDRLIPPVSPQNSDFVVIRLTADGSADPTFDGDGRAFIGLDGPDRPTAETLAGFGTTADGRIVLGGNVGPYYYPPPWVATAAAADAASLPYYPPVPPLSPPGFGVARLTADGAPDPTFGGDGTVLVEATPDRATTFLAMAVLPDGRVVLAGSYQPPADRTLPVAVRLTADGTPDPAFGEDGFVAVPELPQDDGTTPFVYARGVAAQPDGGVVLWGDGYPVSPPDFPAPSRNVILAVRLTPAGETDPGFGAGGRVSLPLPHYSYATRLTAAPDGRLLLVAQAPEVVAYPVVPHALTVPPYPTPNTTTVYRFTPAGRPDPTFAPDGRVVLPAAPPGQAVLGSLAVTDPAGRVLVAGNTDHSSVTGTRIALARLAPSAAPPPAPVLVNGPGGTATEYAPGPDGKLAAAGTVEAFPGYTGAVRVTRADVNGDGAPDAVAAIGPGGGSRVRVAFGTPTGAAAPPAPVEFAAFESSFTGGVFAAAADLDGDGKAEVIVTPDEGGGPVVAVYRGAALAGGDTTPAVRFYGIEDADFRGGARPALGDVNGDGAADLIVSAGFLGGPRVAVFDGRDLAAGRSAPGRLVNDFFAFEDTLRNGAFVTAGDLTGDGRAELIFGGGPSGGPRVRVIDGARLLAAGAFTRLDEIVGSAQVANFFAGGAAQRGGVRLAARDVDGDGRADLLTGSGDGEPSRVRVYMAGTVLANLDPAADQELDPFGATLPGGVFVG